MTETEEKPKEKKPAKSKKGLHGWKAALAVVGCGTLAAFGIFGVVVALLGSFLSTVSDGVQSNSQPQQGPQPTANPREEFDGDRFDLCDIAEDISGVDISFTENPGNIEDTSMDGGEPGEDDLVRSDNCSGIIRPATSFVNPWDFSFEYQAIIYSPDGGEEEIAEDNVAEAFSRTEESFGDVQESGQVDFLDEGHYVYSSRPRGGSDYSVVGRKRSVVVEISMSSEDQHESAEFFNEINNIDKRLNVALQVLVPE